MATGTLQNPLLLPPATSAPNNAHPFLKITTLISYTIATVSTFASLTYLSTRTNFKALTHPHTTPAIILISLIVARFHMFLFRSARGLLISQRDEISGWHIRFMIMYYAVGESVQVQVFVFIVVISVDLFDMTKVVVASEGRRRLFHHILMGAMVRASNEYYFRGFISFGSSTASLICIHAVELVFELEKSYRI